MDKRVKLQRAVRTSDGQGGWSETWEDLTAVWAGISPATGYERFQTMQNATPITHNIMIRYYNDLTAADRILYGTRILHIKEIINLEEANVFLKIKAIEV